MLFKAKDKTGNNLSIGGDDFYVKVTPPAGSKPVIASVVDNGDGTYSVEYQPNAPGNHTVEVLLNEELVGGAALTVPVTQTTDPSKTVAYGPGFEDASTGNPAIFMIRAKDSKGNNVLRGGDAFKATLKAPGGADVPATIKDNNNGTYVVTFVPTAPGNHVLDISLDGKPISNRFRSRRHLFNNSISSFTNFQLLNNTVPQLFLFVKMLIHRSLSLVALESRRPPHQNSRPSQSKPEIAMDRE